MTTKDADRYAKFYGFDWSCFAFSISVVTKPIPFYTSRAELDLLVSAMLVQIDSAMPKGMRLGPTPLGQVRTFTIPWQETGSALRLQNALGSKVHGSWVVLPTDKFGPYTYGYIPPGWKSLAFAFLREDQPTPAKRLDS